MTENEVYERTVQQLQKHFFIYPEHWSVDGKSRIDIIIKDKITDVLFGIELKRIDYKRGEDGGKLLKQAMRYATSDFKVDDKIQKIPIFIAPPLSHNMFICPNGSIEHENRLYYKDRHQEHNPHHTANGFIGVFNVGEIRTIKESNRCYYIFTTSNQIIWTSKLQYNKIEPVGLHKVNYEKLMAKINK